MTTLEIHPDYRALLEAAGLATFDALFAAGEDRRIDGHRLRSVSRLELRGTDGAPVVIYLKRQWGERAAASWRNLARLRWPETPARREWKNTRRLAAAAVPVAPPVAWGRSTASDQVRALIAFCEVRGPSLAAWLHAAAGSRASPAHLRHAVAAAVGRAVRRLHDAGFSFPDLYGKHLYLEDLESGEPTVVLIDVQRLRPLLPWRDAIDLAALYVSTQALGVRRTDRLRVLRAYVGEHDLGPVALRLIRRTERAAARIPGRGQDPNLLRARAPGATGTASLAQERFVHIDGGRLWASEDFRPVLEAANLATLDALMNHEGGESYRVVPGRSTVRLELPDPSGGRRAAYLKRYTRVPLGLRLRRMLSLNPPLALAEREVRSITRIADLGLPTIRYVAFGDDMTRGGHERSCLLTEELAGAVQADKYFQANFAGPLSREQTAMKRRLIRAVARLARRLHAARLSHRDFYLCHILVRPVAGADPALHLIDLQRLTHHGRGMGERWAVKDLGAMLFSSRPSAATHIRSPVFTRTDAVRFARAYFGAARLGPDHKRLLRKVAAKARRIASHEARRQARKEAGA